MAVVVIILESEHDDMYHVLLLFRCFVGIEIRFPVKRNGDERSPIMYFLPLEMDRHVKR